MAARLMRPTRLLCAGQRALRRASSAASSTPPKFGKAVAADASASQNITDITRGRYDYLTDFMASMQRGPVKLEFGDRAPTAKEMKEHEAQERALKMMQRSMLLGTFVAFGGVYFAWWLSKRALGVNDAKEFSQAMSQKMPKVSGDMENSMLGRRLKEQSAASRDAISEDPELTAWRRSLRDKFNTPEGKQLARQNSILMAERRKKDRIERQLKGGAVSINSSNSGREVPQEVVNIVTTAKAAEDAKNLEDEAKIVRTDSRVIPRSEANKLKRRASVSWAGGATGSSSGWAQRGPS